MSKRDHEISTIDVHVEKLVDWLLARNNIKHKWQQALKPIRERIKQASAALPFPVKTQLGGKDINYFTVLEIIGLLEEAYRQEHGADAKLRSFFGSYLCPQLKRWEAVRRKYEKDNIFLAEGARLLVQNTVYEMPAMKATVRSGDKQIEDLGRRISDGSRSSLEFWRKYIKQSEELGLKIKNKNYEDYLESLSSSSSSSSSSSPHCPARLRQKIKASTKHLSPLMAGVERSVTSAMVGEALQYYACFMQFIARRNRPAPSSSREAGAGAGAGNSNNENSSNGDSKDDAGTVMNGAVDMSLASLLPTLHAFHSQTPPVVPPVSDDGDGESDEDDEDGGIDWNITLEEDGDGGDGGAGIEIDWGAITLEASGDTGDGDGDGDGEGEGEGEGEGGGGEIDWDIGVVGAGDDAGDDAAGVVADIDWGITLADDNATADHGSKKSSDAGEGGEIDFGMFACAEPGLDGEQAGAQPQLSLLEAGVRASFLNELVLLEAFFLQRQEELAAISKSGVYNGQFTGSDAPVILQSQSSASMHAYLQCIQELIGQLRDPRINQLTLIGSSTRYVDRLVLSLQQALASVSRLHRHAQEREEQCRGLSHTIMQTKKSMADARLGAQALKQKVADSVSRLYDGRRVNIQGNF